MVEISPVAEKFTFLAPYIRKTLNACESMVKELNGKNDTLRAEISKNEKEIGETLKTREMCKSALKSLNINE